MAIPSSEWPKLCDAATGEKFKPIAQELYPDCLIAGCGLWILEPGHVHPAHEDGAKTDWIVRVHVPIITNVHVVATMKDGPHQMIVGKAYRFNILEEHSVSNGGTSPRVHFIFDVHSNHL